jgi:curved DNA-binding protein CbpA
MDPYEVLGVEKNFKWDDLTKNYKRLAKLVHPDKGGSEEVFNAVTECFRKLAREFKAREEKTHDELRNGARSYAADMQSRSADVRGTVNVGADADDAAGFREKFNTAFEKNRLEDDDGTGHGIGYGAKMAASTGKVREDFSIPRVMKKYDTNTFNKVFETVTLADTREVIKYREPDALPVSKSLQYTELGKASTGDFSSTTEGEARRTLQYTDYMKAYTTTRLVDPRGVEERKKYRNVDEYESARADAASRPESEDERQWRKKKQHEVKRPRPSACVVLRNAIRGRKYIIKM